MRSLSSMSDRAMGAAIWFSVTLIMTAIVFTAGPRYEGTLWPVTNMATIDRIEATDGGSLIWATFTKRRDCEYLGLSWYERHAGTPDRRVRLVLRPGERDDSGVTRPTGEQSAGPWFLALAPSIVQSDSYAIVNHRCHPFWITRTRFYDAAER